MERSPVERPNISGYKIIVSPTKTYTIDDVLRVAKNTATVHIPSATTEHVLKNFHAAVELQTQDVYGFTTGVADLSKERDVSPELQSNILLSHATAVGDPLSEEETRGLLFCRLLNLGKGMSGVRPELLKYIAAQLNTNVIPRVGSIGSIGAGDPPQLGEAFLPILNKGTVIYELEERTPYEAFAEAGMQPPGKLQSREGLALIEGNDATTGMAALTVEKFEDVIGKSIVAAALSMEARTATSAAFEPTNQRNKPFVGQALAAKDLADMLQGSDQISTQYGKENSRQIQDPPSYKTIVQSTGSAIYTLESLKTVVLTEINALTDNPVLTEEGKFVSSGNYLNTTIAHALDSVAPEVVSLLDASLSRMKVLTDEKKNEGLPPYLIANAGTNTGFMISIYTANAAVEEAKAQSDPKAIHSASVANGWEDVASNGFNAAKNARDVVDMSYNVLAIEMLIACQAIALRLKETPELQLGKSTRPIFEKVKDTLKLHENGVVLPAEKDFYVGGAIKIIKEMLLEEDFPSPDGFKQQTTRRAQKRYEDDKEYVESLLESDS